MTDINQLTDQQLHTIVTDRVKRVLYSCYSSMVEMHISGWMEKISTENPEIKYNLAGSDSISNVVWDEPPLPGVSHLIRSASVDELMEKLPLNSLIEFMDEDLIHSQVSTVMVMYKLELIDSIVQRCTSHKDMKLRELSLEHKQSLINALTSAI